MELYSAESKRIQTLVQEWLNYPKPEELELEATFGAGGVVDSTTFLQIAQRLRMKGYEQIQQDDRLSIITPKHIRLTLQGLGVLQSYCRDDTLEGKPFTAMIKDRNTNVGSKSAQGSDIDLQEYNVRIKSRREIPMDREDPRIREYIDNWKLEPKAFRLIRRWSFHGKGIRIDMSMVRSTPKDARGNYRMVKSFLDHNLFKETPHYEVEVELKRGEYTSTAADAVKVLIGGIGEILRGMQKNSLLIRNSTIDKTKNEYGSLVKSDRFRGVAPVTLGVKNITEEIQEGGGTATENQENSKEGEGVHTIPNIRTGYNVTDKADGLRTHGFCDKNGEFFLIDMSMNVYRTGLKNKSCALSLVDGEWVTRSKDGRAISHYLVFDIYYAPGGKDVSGKDFVDIMNIDKGDGRYNLMKQWYTSFKDGMEVTTKTITDSTRMLVSMKNFQFATPNNSSIFGACARVLDTNFIYNTDGLILSPNKGKLPSKPSQAFFEQFKWKPAIDNTVDFLVKFERDPSLITAEKITTGIHPENNQTLRYKTLRLYVGSEQGATYDDPRSIILQNLPIITEKEKKATRKYKPVLFSPSEFPDTMANTCNIETMIDQDNGEEYVETEMTKEPIRDGTIVEMRYDPLRESGWRWIPIRIRHDKTERLQRGIINRTLNSKKVANDVWNSIHDPVTESMIRTGNDSPTEEEVKALMKVHASDVAKKYYERTASKEDIMLIRGMLDFHNKYIKNEILYKRLLKGGGKKVLDLACGKAGDLYKWKFGRARTVIGIDVAGENITNPEDGAYSRYVQAVQEFGRNRVPEACFIIGNSSRNIVSGEAGATPEERDMLRSIFGKYDPEGPVPKYVETALSGTMRAGADVAVCMFAIHYFFETKDTLDGFITNLRDTVKVGGYFAGAAFDGDKVFNLLRNVDVGHSKSGKEGDVPIWTITKQYEKEEFVPDESSIGLPIDVEFISIGATHREYLVSFAYLQKRLEEIGFELLDKDELENFNLKNSTNTFDASYDMATKQKKMYVIPDSVKQFSFLNRWFIFKRVGDIGVGPVPSDISVPVQLKEPEKEFAVSIAPSRDETDAEIMGEIAEDRAASSEEERDVAEGEIDVMEPGAFRLPPPDKKFTDNEIYRFGPDALLQDRLRIKDTGAARWTSLYGQFPIPDPDDGTILYPTTEHYIAGMKLKYASNKPNLAKELMSSSGKVHQEFLAKRRTEGGIKSESTRDFEMLASEIKEVRSKLTKTALNQYRAAYDENKWIPIKDRILMQALQYRWEHDDRFRKIVEAAREQGKYMLYSMATGSGAGELSGVRRADGKIEGENKVGKFIMEIAGFMF
jgi:hypothetical protein